jgi:hypothetical protein
VLKARIRLTAGLATRISNGHGMPNQKSIPKRMPMNTMPVPRSGCAMMRSHGTPTTSAGFHSSSSVFGASRCDASTRASISTTVSFASSAG